MLDLKIAILSDFKIQKHFKSPKIILSIAENYALSFFEKSSKKEQYNISKILLSKELFLLSKLINAENFKESLANQTPLFYNFINSFNDDYKLNKEDILNLFVEIDKNSLFISKNIENTAIQLFCVKVC